LHPAEAALIMAFAESLARRDHEAEQRRRKEQAS
jgi:hypothetical protein